MVNGNDAMLAINNSHLDWDGGVQEVAEHDYVLGHQKVFKRNEAKTVLLAKLVDGLVGVEGVTANVGEEIYDVLHLGHFRICWQCHIEGSLQIFNVFSCNSLNSNPLEKDS